MTLWHMLLCVRRFLLLRQCEATGISWFRCGPHLFRHQSPRDFGQCHKEGQCFFFKISYPPLNILYQHLISAVTLEHKPEKNLFLPHQHLVSTQISVPAVFYGSTIEQISTEVRASHSFISSKCLWILDLRSSEEWKVRVKNERWGFAAGWVREEYQIRKLATPAISKRSCCRACSLIMSLSTRNSNSVGI